MKKKIYFDMDGTVYDLYGIPNWLERLRNEDEKVYSDGKPIFNMEILNAICNLLVAYGWELGIITWLSKDASEDYNERVTKIKKEWQENYMPYITEFHALPYGTPKTTAIIGKPKKCILIDDNTAVRMQWTTPKQRKTINPNDDNFFTALLSLLDE